MQKWSTSIDPRCVLCSGGVESIAHLFFECQYSGEVWEILTKGLMRQRYTKRWAELVTHVAGSIQDGVYCFLIRYTFQAAIHLVWQARNRRKHGESPKTPVCLAGIIEAIIKNRMRSVRGKEMKLEEAMIRWFESRD